MFLDNQTGRKFLGGFRGVCGVWSNNNHNMEKHMYLILAILMVPIQGGLVGDTAIANSRHVF